MSEKARELAAWFVKHYGLESEEEGDDGTCSVCVKEVDQAVAPLVELADKYAGHRMTCQTMKGWGSCDCGFDDAQEALKGWKP